MVCINLLQTQVTLNSILLNRVECHLCHKLSSCNQPQVKHREQKLLPVASLSTCFEFTCSRYTLENFIFSCVARPRPVTKRQWSRRQTRLGDPSTAERECGYRSMGKWRPGEISRGLSANAARDRAIRPSALLEHVSRRTTETLCYPSTELLRHCVESFNWCRQHTVGLLSPTLKRIMQSV